MQYCCKYNTNATKNHYFCRMNQMAETILSKHKLRKTPFRIQVLEVFLNSRNSALKNIDLEEAIKDFDRITLYRTIKTFEKSGIIHQAIDGSNESKYALCSADCSEHHHEDDHAHFFCNACHKTYCLENAVSAQLSLPQDFKLSKMHIALNGVCVNCN